MEDNTVIAIGLVGAFFIIICVVLSSNYTTMQIEIAKAKVEIVKHNATTTGSCFMGNVE